MRDVTKRPLLAAALLVPALLLAGCSGDDEPEAGASPSGSASTTPAEDGSPSATATEEPVIPPITGDPCRTTVKLTGDVRKAWTKRGTVVTDTGGGPVAVYQSTDGSIALTAYAAGNGFETSVIVNAGTASYGSAAGAKGLAVKADGSGATVRVDAVAPGNAKKKVRVVATFRC